MEIEDTFFAFSNDMFGRLDEIDLGDALGSEAKPKGQAFGIQQCQLVHR